MMKSNTIVINGKNNLDAEVVTIGEENTVIQVLYSGICGTDLHLISKFKKKDAPFSIGHEFVGKIYKNPPEGFYIGDEVVIVPGKSCNKCIYCTEYKNSNLCIDRVSHGMTLHKYDKTVLGGCSTFVELVKGIRIYKIPPKLPSIIATLAEPLSVGIRAINKIRGLIGKNILILGGGPIGSICGLLLRNKGYQITICDTSEYRREYIKSNFEINTVRPDNLNDIFDFIFDCTGNPNSIKSALNCIRRGGRIILVGNFISNGKVEIDPSIICRNEVEIVGSVLGAEDKYQEALNILLESTELWRKMITHIFSFDEKEQAFQFAKEANAMKVVIVPDIDGI
ncbi:alcohol dehydrogenase catalytic domain-containing protein [Streptococcus pneumoniae]|nr:alcohol dehydrogenase catalytic domain-containing protein [Streptococcus pneumoniae]HEU3701989.1 alcohol dehydrogenase catalytic domain-containing protein [Streptococcus pneumoniae]